MDVGLAPTAGFIASTRPTAAERKRRRESRRTTYRVPCRVTLYDPITGASIKLVGQTTNISRGGLSVQLARDAMVGTWVEALVPQTGGNPMFICGVVAHRRRVLAGAYEIGIEFAGQGRPAVF